MLASGVLNTAFVSMVETPEGSEKAVAHKWISVDRRQSPVYIGLVGGILLLRL